jgi:DNA-binding CsgD family transcriptional regulator
LLLDAFLRPLYANEEAVSILSHPENPQDKKRLGYFLTQRVASLLPKGDGSIRWNFASEFVSGKRRYQIRAFTLKSRLGNTLGAAMAVLLQRNRRRPANPSFAEKFHLTQRENEALELLMRGHATKQIASCMHISPNTAKAFLRSVMFKMGVSYRSGILVKILQVSERIPE